MPKPSAITVVKNSYRFLWNNKPYFWSVVRPLLPFYAVYGILFYLMPVFVAQLQNPQQHLLLSWLFASVGVIVTIPASLSLSISWYRGYLLGPTSDSLVGPLELKKPHWEFFGKRMAWLLLYAATLTVIILITVVLCIAARAMNVPLLMIVIIPAAFIASAIGICHLMRLTLYFPAKAIGEYLSFASARRLGKGTGRSIILAVILTEIPVLIIGGVISILKQHSVHGLGYDPETSILFTIALALLGLVIGPVFYMMCVSNVAQYYQWVSTRHSLTEPASAEPSDHTM